MHLFHILFPKNRASFKIQLNFIGTCPGGGNMEETTRAGSRSMSVVGRPTPFSQFSFSISLNNLNY